MSATPTLSATQPLLVDVILSLDGCAAGEGWPGWWGLQSPEYLDWLGQEPEYLTLMGANTYRLMPQMAEQAAGIDVPEEEKASFARMAEMPKVAFSSTLETPLSWPNTTLVELTTSRTFEGGCSCSSTCRPTCPSLLAPMGSAER